MDQQVRNKLRNVVTQCRKLLEESIAEQLEGQFGIRVGKKDAVRVEDEARMSHLSDEDREFRRELLAHFGHLQSGGLKSKPALEQFFRETAFTWLNRLVALKMLESRRIVRETVTRLENSNGFKIWLAEGGHESQLSDYERGGDAGRQAAYRAFLLDQCRRLSEEVRVLFDPDTLSGRFLPAPSTLRELLERFNDPDLTEAWQPGNEETIGWVYQGFNQQEKKDVFHRLYREKQKARPEDIPAATQLFTPRWIVRCLVENTLGRLWLELHRDSQLADSLSYLVCPDTKPTKHQGQVTGDKRHAPKSVKEITLLDPACGTMHFGLVAFDLFVEMYREEMQNAGRPGWPDQPPVACEEEIPAAIIAHNIHGIDIDLRAVQLSALTLYLKAKTLNPRVQLTESRLACANVHMLDGDNLQQFVDQSGLGPIYRRILSALQERLKDSEQLGSLLRLEDEIRRLIEQERNRYEKEAQAPDLFGWHRDTFGTEAGQREFWEMLEAQIGQALDAFARAHAGLGSEQAFFAGETTKGLRLLELMAERYDVVVTNPPYMTSRNMNATLKKLVQQQYPLAKSDLYACFIHRCSEWLRGAGYVGMIAQQSFMFISSYEKLRKGLLDKSVIEVVLHVGPRAFEEVTGEKVNTVAFVLRREVDAAVRRAAVGTYFRLVKQPDSEAKRRKFEEALWAMRSRNDECGMMNDEREESDECGMMNDELKQPDIHHSSFIIHHYKQSDFDAIPGSPWVYWITPGLRKLFQTFPKLGDVATTHCGMTTSDNFRFLRFWWEVGIEHISFFCRKPNDARESRNRWFPYMKGGTFCRWYGNQSHVVNWENNGAEIKAAPSFPRAQHKYFRRGVTWTDLTSGRFSARLSPGGFIFDVSGSCAFPPDVEFVLGLLNSTLAQYVFKLVNPTVHVQVGDLARLPVPESSSDALRRLVDDAVTLAKVDSEEDETTWDFIAPPDWPEGIEQVHQRHLQLAEIEREIDEEVYRLYGISDEDRQAIEKEVATDKHG